jgi:hypothetical protein
VFWYKTDQNVVGAPHDLTFAVEVMLLGIKRSREDGENRCKLDNNPTKRHNIIMGPAIHTMRKDTHGTVINAHEKPDYVSGWVAERWLMPFDWVIVIGGGRRW